MYKLYKITSAESDKFYIGMTKNELSTRFWQHKNAAKKKSTKAYNWMAKYLSTLEIELIASFERKEDCCDAEVEEIRMYADHIVNIAPGGTGGFVIQDIEDWKAKLSKARIGKRPALGMKHSEETKQKLREITASRKPKYPVEEVLKMSCKEAKEAFGISKTHYLRLRRKYGADSSASA